MKKQTTMNNKVNRQRTADNRYWQKSLVFILLSLAMITSANAQQLQSYSDKNYNEKVQTVLLHPTLDSLAKPVIHLNDMMGQLHLQFDVFANDAPYMYYKFVHCNNDWTQQSDIQQVEYLEGFESDDIENYSFSLNTMVDYVHFDLVFPTENMIPKISGNYLLIVYEDELTPENIYFTRRFMIVDDKATFKINIPRYPFDLSLGTNNQQLEMTVSYPDLFNSLASQYSNVTIQQNGRWDNAVMGLKPTYVYPDYLSYENNVKTVFNSGNQFRRFNTSNLNNRPEQTKDVEIARDYYIVELYPNQKRNTQAYITDHDLFGGKIIYLERDDRVAATEADYVLVEFFLEWEPVMTTQDVYIMGAITDWSFDENNKMTYDYERKGYALNLLLKQGYYDYIYAVKERGEERADVTPIAGNFWETMNEYTVYLYLFDPTQNYDQLIGVKTVLSH
ncbi:MAG: DUF5103 domain-containing protein [Bacteroidales bacterium]|nr:DUF5103 domain-containing protein [Bacteroidales bacterium]